MVSLTIKAVLISTGIILIMTPFLKISLPLALDLSLSQPPVLWNSFLSWLKPPYLFIVINVIITIIVASSSYHDGEEDKVSHRDEPVIYQAPPIVVADVDRSEVVHTEKEEEISVTVNSGDEFGELRTKLDQVVAIKNESENLSPVVKPTRSVCRKPDKAGPKGGNRKKVKPKQRDTTLEKNWKIITDEEKSMPLTSNYRRTVTFGTVAGGLQPALRKSETFRDMTNYQKSSSVKPVKMKKVMSPSRDELNRRVEEFIRKCKEERLVESFKLDKDVA